MKFSLLLVVIVHLFFIHTSICCPVNAKAVRRFGRRIYPIDGCNSPWPSKPGIHVFLVPRFIRNKHQIKQGGLGRLWISRDRRTCLKDTSLPTCPSLTEHICFSSCHDDLNLRLNTTSKRPGYSRVVARWMHDPPSNVANQTITVSTPPYCGNKKTEKYKTFNVTKNATSFRVLNLRANSKVWLHLTVQTESGKVYCQKECIETEPTAPTGPPHNVTARVKRRRRKLTFRWEEPKCEHRHGNIEYYEYILYRSTVKQPKTGRTNSTYQTFEGLRLNEHYSFDVTAKGTGGRGPYSRPVGGYF